MQINFSEAIRKLTPGATVRIANEARPPASYLFNSILPERLEFDYQAKAGSMVVRTTMAGLAGVDSPYPEGGIVQTTQFSEGLAKIAIAATLPEAVLRRMQQMVAHLTLGGTPTIDFVQREILNFEAKIIVQAMLDTAEWLRGQIFCANGVISWTFNGITLSVDYGIPAGNILTSRAGADGYGGATSKFWTDVQAARTLLRNNVRAFIAHPETVSMIRYNAVNSHVVVGETASTVTLQRKTATVDGSSINFLSPDSADRVTLVSYGNEGEVFDLSNPGQTLKIPFMARGKIAAIANNDSAPYVVGAGSTPPIQNVLGYTHVGPTVEGGGGPGRWAEVYTPEQEPWSLRGRGASNILPVVEAPEKIVIMTTAMV